MRDDDPSVIGEEPAPLLMTDRDVLLPGAVAPHTILRGDGVEFVRETRSVVVVCLRAADAPYREASSRDHFYDIACLAHVRAEEESEAGLTLILEGVARVRLDSLTESSRGPRATVKVVRATDEGGDVAALAKTVRSLSLSIIDRMPGLPAEARSLTESVEAPGDLADWMASNLDLPFTEKAEFLQETSAEKRLRRLLVLLARQLEILELRTRIDTKVRALHAREPFDGSDRNTLLRLQRALLAEELAAEETASPRKGWFGSMLATLRRAPAEDVDAIRARLRREVAQLQLEAIDAELGD